MGQSDTAVTYEQFCDQQRSLLVDNVDIKYIDEGEGPVILLIHGVPTSGWLYRKIFPRLVENGFRVIVPDMMGFGQSLSSDTDIIPDIAAQGRVIESLCRELDLKSVYLAVHDAGGPFAWSWLIHSRVDIKALFLFNTILYLEGFKPPINMKKGSLGFKMIRWAYTTPWLGKMIVRSTLNKGTEKHKLSKKDKEGYLKPIEKGAGDAIMNFLGSFDQLTGLCKSAKIELKVRNTPICAIWGENDPFLIGHEQLPRAMDQLNLKNENTHILGGSGHFIQEDAPNDIVDLIIRFTDTSDD